MLPKSMVKLILHMTHQNVQIHMTRIVINFVTALSSRSQLMKIFILFGTISFWASWVKDSLFFSSWWSISTIFYFYSCSSFSFQLLVWYRVRWVSLEIKQLLKKSFHFTLSVHFSNTWTQRI
jgi:hypothetical protein